MPEEPVFSCGSDTDPVNLKPDPRLTLDIVNEVRMVGSKSGNKLAVIRRGKSCL